MDGGMSAQRGSESGRVLVVDSNSREASDLSTLLRQEGYAVTAATNGRRVLDLIAREQPDVVVLDVSLPGSSGFELCLMLKLNPSTRMIPIVLLTVSQDRGDRARGLEAGADDFFTRPVNVAELRARLRSLIRLRRFTDELDSAQTIIRSLATTIEARDPATGGHCQRLAGYATALGTALCLAEEDIQVLRDGGFLHDIGKVAVPDMILLKPGPLTAPERERMKSHTIVGDALCGRFRSLARVREIVRHHHERFDGSGYPDGLRGEGIPFLAQIISLVDAFDALTSARPYKLALSSERAFAELTREAERGWRRRDLTAEFIALGRSGQLKIGGLTAA